MPRTYQKKPGSRSYKNYSEETLNEALAKSKKEGRSLNSVAKQYGISQMTLKRKLTSE